MDPLIHVLLVAIVVIIVAVVFFALVNTFVPQLAPYNNVLRLLVGLVCLLIILRAAWPMLASI